MTNRRLLRSLLLICALIVLLSAALFTIVWIEFPSVGEVRNELLTLKRPILVPPSPQAQSGAGVLGDSGRAPASFRGPTPGIGVNPITTYFVERYIRRGEDDVRVCDNLSGIQDTPPQDQKSLNHALTLLADGTIPENPFLESVIAPLGAVLSVPSVSSMVGPLLDAATTGDRSFIDSPNYSSAVATAMSDLMAQRERFGRISQHAYHLYTLARAAALNPVIISDPRLMDLCLEIESRLESDSNEEDAEVLLDEERLALLDLLVEAGISPYQVGFIPETPATPDDIGIEASRERISLNSAWMLRQFGGGPTLTIQTGR